MKPVLILDANQRSALAVTRSLGSHGVLLVTADETVTALAGRSCYSKQYVSYPSPRLQPDHFISAIAEICKKEKINIVFPMTELTTGLPRRYSGPVARPGSYAGAQTPADHT